MLMPLMYFHCMPQVVAGRGASSRRKYGKTFSPVTIPATVSLSDFLQQRRISAAAAADLSSAASTTSVTGKRGEEQPVGGLLGGGKPAWKQKIEASEARRKQKEEPAERWSGDSSAVSASSASPAPRVSPYMGSTYTHTSPQSLIPVAPPMAARWAGSGPPLTFTSAHKKKGVERALMESDPFRFTKNASPQPEPDDTDFMTGLRVSKGKSKGAKRRGLFKSSVDVAGEAVRKLLRSQPSGGGTLGALASAKDRSNGGLTEEEALEKAMQESLKASQQPAATLDPVFEEQQLQEALRRSSQHTAACNSSQSPGLLDGGTRHRPLPFGSGSYHAPPPEEWVY